VSGIVGIFHRDGDSLVEGQLRSMTNFLAYRGPDGQDMWQGGQAGFGHTSLNTSQEPGSQKQLIQMESLCITADVRLDSKSDLIRKLQASGRRTEGHASDAELVLHAYAAWGPGCVENLRGDFSFAVWDSVAKILFCARDHFGIKPFYYVETGKVFIFSNTLDCLRRCAGVTASGTDGWLSTGASTLSSTAAASANQRSKGANGSSSAISSVMGQALRLASVLMRSSVTARRTGRQSP